MHFHAEAHAHITHTCTCTCAHTQAHSHTWGDRVAQLVVSDSRLKKKTEVRIPPGAQEKLVSFSESKYADSLLVCPTPICICTHKNDYVRTLSMSEFSGLRKQEKTQQTLIIN